MKNKPVIITMLGGFLLSFWAVANVVAEETTWLNTHKFITGENVMISHDAPGYAGSIKVQYDNDDGVPEDGEIIALDDAIITLEGEIITRFKIKKDYELTSVSLCLREYESAPPFAINIYRLGVPSLDLNEPPMQIVLDDTLLLESTVWSIALTECSEIPLGDLSIPVTDPPLYPNMVPGETLLLGISFDFGLPAALPDPEPVVALDSELPMSAIISAVGLGQTSTYLMIDDCNTFVSDVEFDDGTPLSEVIAECEANAKNHGKFVSCVTKAANKLKKQRVISGKEKGKITRCAAQSSLP